MNKPIEITRTIYPRLPDLPDEETIALVTTLESEERDFALKARFPRGRYHRALYLKAMAYLGHSHFSPGELPRLMRLRLAEELHLSKDLADLRQIHPVEKCRIVSEVRSFLGLDPYSQNMRAEAELWIAEKIAREEGDILSLVNATIRWFREEAVELPAFQVVCTMSETALKFADQRLYKRFRVLAGTDEAKRLDELLVENEGRTPFDRFKDDVRAPSSVNIRTELGRLKDLESYLFPSSVVPPLSRRKTDYFAEMGVRYTASELRQLRPGRRLIILLCYLMVRQSQLLDAVAEQFVLIWGNTRTNAVRHANEYLEARRASQERNEAVLGDLLDIICESPTDHDLIRKIRSYRAPQDYEQLREDVHKGLSWNECYHRKLRDHYTSLRRFLPDWYEEVPLVSTTADDSIHRGIAFLTEQANPNESTLPINGIPTEFLSADWERRAIERNTWNKRIARVHKAPYELGLAEAMADSLKERTLAVQGGRQYAPMTQHLLPREEFFAQYSSHLERLHCPPSAAEYYRPVREELAQRLDDFDRRYKEVKKEFRVNRNGTLSYSRAPSQKIPRRAQKLALRLQALIKPVTILDVFLDCHRLTGFLDAFRPLSGRQNMSEAERILGMIATLYAYGCNSGPSQASQATGLRKQAILYYRRHYMGIRQLMEAASTLVDAYGHTQVSQHLQDPGIFMTDSMRFPTLEDSLSARHHFRYKGRKSILLYQHVMASCICFFTKALLCDVSEAIHMLDGVHKQTSHLDPSINICDNAGRSDFVLGLAHLLNIEIWSRLRSRQNLKLWAPEENSSFREIGRAIAGVIRWDFIDEGWKDMIWILASIAAGKADPSLVATHLNSQKKHPATRGFGELGKVIRNIHQLRYGLDMNLRSIVIRYTSRRESWNYFGRNVFNCFGGMVREKSLENQEEIFWFLTVVQNAIVLWNALALDQSIQLARQREEQVEEEDLKHILPTMIDHINFVGRFDLDLKRKPPFRLVA